MRTFTIYSLSNFVIYESIINYNHAEMYITNMILNARNKQIQRENTDSINKNLSTNEFPAMSSWVNLYNYRLID